MTGGGDEEPEGLLNLTECIDFCQVLTFAERKSIKSSKQFLFPNYENLNYSPNTASGLIFTINVLELQTIYALRSPKC